MSRDTLASQFDEEKVPGADDVFGVRAPNRIPRRKEVAFPPNAIIPVNDGDGLITHRCGRFELTRVGVQMPLDVESDEWELLGDVLCGMETSIQWLIGDWARYAIENWQYTYEHIADQFGLAVETLYTYVSACARFAISIRNRDVSFSHHRLVQGMQDRWAIYWLEKASEARWTVKQMSAAIKKEKSKRSGNRPTLFSDPALKRGKRLISKQEEIILKQKLVELTRLKDGVSEATLSTKEQIMLIMSELRNFLNDVERSL